MLIKVTPIRHKSPIYSINKPIGQKSEIKEKKNELINNKIVETKKHWEDKKIKFIDDIGITMEKLNKPKGKLRYHLVIFFILFYIIL